MAALPNKSVYAAQKREELQKEQLCFIRQKLIHQKSGKSSNANLVTG
jgi:hypothetical protein